MQLIGKQGFTMIELVIVILIIAVLSGIAVPAYYSIKSDTVTSAKVGLIAKTRGALAMAIAQQKAAPTITQLAYLTHGAAVDKGINYMIDGKAYTVCTYLNSTCSQPTTSVNNFVNCVNDSPKPEPQTNTFTLSVR